MDEQNPNRQGEPEHQPEILTNNYGATHDSTVVVEEADRTVVLTDAETIVIPKEPTYNVVPNNRPRRVYAGMWGSTEIATVGVAMLAILTTILLFVFLVLPARREVEQNRAERDRLERELTTAKARYGSSTTTEEQVAKLVSSVSDFETRFLPVASSGRAGLYQRLNGLISAYGLVNTTGPDYAPLEIADGTGGQASDENGGKTKFQSIFPGVYVTMTVEGSYQNLRRFIREVETSQQFVIVSSVELEPSDNKANPNQNRQNQVQQAQATQPNQPNIPNTVENQALIAQGQMMPQPQRAVQPNVVRGKTQGETVSLRLEMAAYFRRPNFVPPAPVITQ